MFILGIALIGIGVVVTHKYGNGTDELSLHRKNMMGALVLIGALLVVADVICHVI